MKSSLYLHVAFVGLCLWCSPCSSYAQISQPSDSAMCSDSLIRHSPHHSADHDHEPIEIGEAVAVGARRSVSINSVSTRLDRQHIVSSMGQSLAQAMQAVSGTSMVQTGANVTKPVIQGMHGTRILIVNNGARQTGQQWGMDHAPEVDLQSAQQLHVVKGAESVRYGSEALGGIVLLEQESLPYGKQYLSGRTSLLYGSNGRRYQAVGRIEGGHLFSKAWAWRLQGSYTNSGDRHTADYVLNNTGARESNLLGSIGYRKGNFKAELTLSRYNHRYGVLPSAQMGNEHLLAERIRIGQPTLFTPWSRRIDYPFQQVAHHNATLKLDYSTPLLGEWKWTIAYQKNKRTEHRFRRQNRSSIPATALNLYSLQQQLGWRKNFEAWNTEIGLQGLYLNNHNSEGTGVVPIIPNYTEQALGLYALERYRNGHFTAEAGLRFDYQRTQAAGYDWTGSKYGGTRRFSNLSYTLAAHYHFNEHLTATSNFGVAWRAPHVYELYSNGNELGSGIYVEGNDQLQSEQGYKWINSLAYTPQNWKIKLDAWVQWIDHYIYDQPTQEVRTVVSGSYPIFAYRQTEALFRGLDLDILYTPYRTINYHLVASLLWAHERSTGKYLPYMPPPRLNQEVRYSPQWWKKTQVWIALRHQYVAQQTRFDPKTDLIATSPHGYHLVGGEIGINFALAKHQQLRTTLTVDNLLNRLYKEYTNRSRYYAHDLGRDIRIALTWQF